MDKKYCTAIVLAAGSGKRMGTKVHKQYLLMGGRPVLYYSLKAFQDSELIDEIILVTGSGEGEYCREQIVEPYGITKVKKIVTGGAERYHSVWNGLQETGDGYVFIHDGARPFVSGDIIERAFQAAEKWGASVVGMPVKDTIKLVDADGCIVDSPNRSGLWQAQTPQVFRQSLLTEAFCRQMEDDCSLITDDAMVVQRQTGVRAHMVEGSYENIKITTPEDLLVAEAFLKMSVYRQ